MFPIVYSQVMQLNQFNEIDAQDEISKLAQMTPEETAEFEAWLDREAEKFFTEKDLATA